MLVVIAGRVGIANKKGGEILYINRKMSATALRGDDCSLFTWYWGELWPNSPICARLPNFLYAAELCT